MKACILLRNKIINDLIDIAFLLFILNYLCISLCTYFIFILATLRFSFYFHFLLMYTYFRIFNLKALIIFFVCILYERFFIFPQGIKFFFQISIKLDLDVTRNSGEMHHEVHFRQRGTIWPAILRFVIESSAIYLN